MHWVTVAPNLILTAGVFAENLTTGRRWNQPTGGR